MKRRTVFGAATALGLAACGPAGLQDESITPLRSGAGVTGTTGSQAQPVIAPIVLPSPEAPQADGKLTLIWFRDFD